MHLPKFEQISAMKHHCGMCGTPFTNPGALKTCIGKHEVICANYHFLFHFIGKAHTCKACSKEEQQQVKRHRAIIHLIKELNKENDAGERPEPEDTAISSLDLELPTLVKMKKKERKAQKKAAKQAKNIDIIKQSDFESLRKIMYPTEEESKAEAKDLEEALAAKFYPNYRGGFTEKRMMDKLMVGPKLKLDFEVETARVMSELELAQPQTKTSSKLFEKIEASVKEDLKVHWNSDIEMRKRRVIYAQWITQGAVDTMASHYKDWNINTGARTNRRYKPSKGKNDAEVFEDVDGLEDRDVISVRSNTLTPATSMESLDCSLDEVDLVTPKKSEVEIPMNDTRRGGTPLFPPGKDMRLGRVENPGGPLADDLPTPKRIKTSALRIVAPPPTPKGNTKSPWGATPKLSNNIPRMTPTAARPRAASLAVRPPEMPIMRPQNVLDLSFPTTMMDPTPAQSTAAWARGYALPAQKTVLEDGPVLDKMIPAPTKTVKALRVLPKVVESPNFADDEGDWTSVGKKGKVKGSTGKNK